MRKKTLYTLFLFPAFYFYVDKKNEYECKECEKKRLENYLRK